MVTVKAKPSRRCAGDTRLRRRDLHHEKAVRKFLKGRDVCERVNRQWEV